VALENAHRVEQVAIVAAPAATSRRRCCTGRPGRAETHRNGSTSRRRGDLRHVSGGNAAVAGQRFVDDVAFDVVQGGNAYLRRGRASFARVHDGAAVSLEVRQFHALHFVALQDQDRVERLALQLGVVLEIAVIVIVGVETLLL